MVGALHVVSTASVVWSVNEVTLSSIVISLSKILVHAIVIGPTRATWYVEIITVAQCINIHAPGQQYRSAVPVNITREHDAILGRSNIYSALCLLTSQALTSLSFRH